MSGTGRHARITKPASAVLDQFEYPALIIENPIFVAGLRHHNEDGYRCDNPYKLGTPERHLWRAGWDFGAELKT